jgi:hypothetical protein
MKLGISSEDIPDHIWTSLDLVKNMSSNQGASEAHPKLGVKQPPRLI